MLHLEMTGTSVGGCIDLRRVRMRAPIILRAALTFAAVPTDRGAKDKGAHD